MSRGGSLPNMYSSKVSSPPVPPRQGKSELNLKGKVKNKVLLQKEVEILQREQYGSIDVSYNSLQDLRPLIVQLDKQSSLVELNLSNNRIDSKSLQALLTLFKTHISLSQIDLSYTLLDDDSVQEIAQSLIDYPLIEKLAINGNPKSVKKGTGKISEMIQQNMRLRSLSLAYNEISDSGLKELITAVLKSNSLSVLILDGNKKAFTYGKDKQNRGINWVCKLIRESKFLTELSLNDIGDITIPDIVMLETALEKNHALVALKLSIAEEKADLRKHIARNEKKRDECIAAVLEKNWKKVHELLDLGVSILSVDKATDKTIGQLLLQNGQGELLRNLAKSDREYVDPYKSVSMSEEQKVITYDLRKVPPQVLPEALAAIYRDTIKDERIFNIEVEILLPTGDRSYVTKAEVEFSANSKDMNKCYILYLKETSWFVRANNWNRQTIDSKVDELILNTEECAKLYQLLESYKMSIAQQETPSVTPIDLLKILSPWVKKTVYSLELPGKQLKERGISGVSRFLSKRNLTLERLDLSDTGLSNEEIASLAESMYKNKTFQLGMLKLNGNSVGLKAMQLICNLFKSNPLQELHVERCEIGDEAAKWLAKAISNSRNFKCIIYIASNHITKDSASLLCEALLKQRNEEKTKIIGSFNSNIFGANGIHKLSLIIKEELQRFDNYTIDCESMGIDNDSIRYLLSIFPLSKPFSLNLAWNSLTCGDWINELIDKLRSQLFMLKSLSLSGNQIGNAGISKLKEGLRESKYLTSLRISDINMDKEVSADVFEAILKFSPSSTLQSEELETLSLAHNNISGLPFAHLMKAITDYRKLSSLNLTGICMSSEDVSRFAECIKDDCFKELHSLYIGYNQLNLASIEQIVKSMVEGSSPFTRLAHMPYLKYLDVRGNSLQINGIIFLLETFEKVKNVQGIVTNGNQLQKGDVHEITRFGVKTLRKLLVRKEKQRLARDEFEEALLEELNNIDTKTKITFYSNTLCLVRGKKKKRIEDLQNYIRENIIRKGEVVNSISLSKIRLSCKEELEPFVEFLTSADFKPLLPKLKQFDVSNNNLVGSGDILAYLVSRSELKSLNICSINIDDIDASYIIIAIKKNPSIKDLNLKGNKLGKKIFQLFETMREDKTLPSDASYNMDDIKALVHNASDKKAHLSFVFDEFLGNTTLLKDQFINVITLANDNHIQRPILFLLNLNTYLSKKTDEIITDSYWTCGIVRDNKMLLVSVSGFCQTDLKEADELYYILSELINESPVNEIYLSVDEIRINSKDHASVAIEILRYWSSNPEFLKRPFVSLPTVSRATLPKSISQYEHLGGVQISKIVTPSIAAKLNRTLSEKEKTEFIHELLVKHSRIIAAKSTFDAPEQTLLESSIYTQDSRIGRICYSLA